MEIRYLSADEKEVNQIAEWIYTEWAYVKPENSVEKIAKLLSVRCNSNMVPLTLVAITGDQLLGAAHLVQTEMSAHPEISKLTPWVSSLFVRPDMRGKGVGEILTKRILEEAKRLGYSKCHLVTDKWEQFYAKRGWQVIRKENQNGKAIVVMECILQ